GPTRSSMSDTERSLIVTKTVVVLGAGVGGLSAAAALRDRLPDTDRVVLVDREFGGVLGLSLLWVLRGWRAPHQVGVKPTAAALPGVDLVRAPVEHIDLDARAVHCGDQTISYDALVIALGAALKSDAVPGLAAALDTGVAGQFYTLDGAVELHRQV